MSRLYVKNFAGYRRIFYFVTDVIVTTVNDRALSRVILPRLVSIINASLQLAE